MPLADPPCDTSLPSTSPMDLDAPPVAGALEDACGSVERLWEEVEEEEEEEGEEWEEEEEEEGGVECLAVDAVEEECPESVLASSSSSLADLPLAPLLVPVLPSLGLEEPLTVEEEELPVPWWPLEEEEVVLLLLFISLACAGSDVLWEEEAAVAGLD